MDCIFCGYTNKFHENQFFYAKWDFYPVSPGHSLLIPKRHFSSFFEIEHKEWQSLDTMINETIKEIENTNLKELYMFSCINPDGPIADYEYLLRMSSMIGKGISPDGYNIGFNEGRSAGQTVDHFHVHIIPRYSTSDLDPTGGIRNILPHGNYKKENGKEINSVFLRRVSR